jgi:hypothetical protein
MTISAGSYSVLSWTGDGTTKAFATTWPFMEAADLVVSVAGVTKTLGSDYTVTGGSDAVGTVTFTTAPAAAAAVRIARSTSAKQVTAYANAGAFPAASHEQALDRVTMLAQETAARSIQGLAIDPAVGALPSAATRANAFLAFDASGNPIATAVAPVGTLTPSTFGTSLAQATDAAAARTLLAVPAASGGTLTSPTITSPTITSPTITSPTITSPTITGPTLNSANGGPLAGLRNRIINGDMRVDQRKSGAATTTSTSAWTYTVDRWYSFSAGATVSGTRAAGTAPNQYVYRFTGAASVTGIGFGQRIEATNIYDLQSGTVTLGVDLANSLLTSVTWTAYYPTTADSYGTFASPTRTSIATGTFTVTSTITRYSAQITLPANAANGLEIVFTVGAQTSGTWTVGNVQIEGGSTATPFERRPVGMELSLCQRYYFDAASGSATVAHQLSATSTAAAATTLPMMNWPPMRTAPTATIQNLTYANGSGLSFTITSPSTAQTYMTFSVAGTGFVAFNVLLSAEL